MWMTGLVGFIIIISNQHLALERIKISGKESLY
jgi:hypothetical protein